MSMREWPRVREGGGIVVFRTQCPLCRMISDVTVPEKGLRARARGAHIQDCFPALSPSEREKLMTGLCGPCFLKACGPDECDSEE